LLVQVAVELGSAGMEGEAVVSRVERFDEIFEARRIGHREAVFFR
jgi:hypothetical protein